MTGDRLTGFYETILVGPGSGNSFPVGVYSYCDDKFGRVDVPHAPADRSVSVLVGQGTYVS